MTGTVWGRRARPAAKLAFVFAALLLAVPPGFAQEGVSPDVERRSDELDVPFVPSEMAVVEAMLGYAKPTKADYVIDLGSGDGRIVITAAAKYGASGHGVDLNAGLVEIANATAAKQGVAERAKFYVRDLFKEDISKATIVTMYLLPEVVLQLRERLFKLRPGTRIASHDYHMGDWRFDAAHVVENEQANEDIVYYWVVPAKVAGRWSWRIEYPGSFHEAHTYEAAITQHFQDIQGRVVVDLHNLRIREPKIQGEKIAFTVTGEIEDRVVRHDFEGVVAGDRITGSVRLSGGVREKTLPWTATRVQADN